MGYTQILSVLGGEGAQILAILGGGHPDFAGENRKASTPHPVMFLTGP